MLVNLKLIWGKQLSSAGADGSPFVATALDGAIYLVGSQFGTSINFNDQKNAGGVDTVLTKYSPEGTTKWSTQIPARLDQYPSGIITGTDGSIYICGYTNWPIDGSDPGLWGRGAMEGYLVKYSSQGSLIWTRTFGTTSADYTTDLSIGPDGSIYIVGTTQLSIDGQPFSGNGDCFLIKYKSDGTKIWTRQFGTLFEDSPNAITVGADGSVYVVGETTGQLVTSSTVTNSAKEAFLTKYSSEGTKIWTKQFDTPSGKSNTLFDKFNSSATAVVTGIDGSIYISGNTTGELSGLKNNGGSDVFLAKYSSNGERLWIQQFGSVQGSSEYAEDICISPDGSVYISGYLRGSSVSTTVLNEQLSIGGYDEVFSAQFSTEGALLRTFIVGTKNAERNSSIASGLDGAIYISGTTTGSLYGPLNLGVNSGNSDIFLVKFQESVTSAPYNSGFIYTPTSIADTIVGSSGIDIVQEFSKKSDNKISQLSNGSFQIQNTFASLNIDILTGIERVQFDDLNVALDVSGNAGKVAKILGSVFGVSYLTNTVFAGIGLAYLDEGMSYKDLCGLAASAAGLSTPDLLVTTLLRNSIGSEPSVLAKSSYLQLISNGASFADVAQQISDSTANAQSIKLTDLTNTGLAYKPYVLPPTYSLSAASASVNEGSTAVFNLTTTNVAVGTEVSYTISGISSSDLTLGTLTGKVSVGVGGTASISIPIAADGATEGQETLTVNAQGSSATMVINDTSQGNATPTYNLTPATNSINEGALAQVYVSTTDVAAGTSLLFSISGVGITQEDVIEGLSRSVTVDSSGKAIISIQTIADLTTEGPETLYITMGTLTTSFIINDTSVTLIGIPEGGDGGGGGGGG